MSVRDMVVITLGQRKGYGCDNVTVRVRVVVMMWLW